MARKVFITSDISVDTRLLEVAESNSLAALLWPWIVTAFDDWGRADADPRRLKAQVFPAIKNVKPTTISEALKLYDSVGLVKLYTVNEKTYMNIPRDRWFKYQTHIRQEKRTTNNGSKFPEPPDDYDAQVRDLSRNVAQSSYAHLQNEPSPSPSPSKSFVSKKQKPKAGAVDNSEPTAIGDLLRNAVPQIESATA